MRFSIFLFAASVMAGAFLTRRVPPLATNEQDGLIEAVIVRTIAAVKSAQLASEKSPSSHLRDIANKLIEELKRELGHIIKLDDSENSGEHDDLLREAQQFRFSYEYNEVVALDEEFIKHQLAQSDDLIKTLHRLRRSADNGVRHLATRIEEIFSSLQQSLQNFRDNFLAVDEHRIRDFAHQIWESEGRPEGQAARHWAMAVELSKKLTSAELQLAFEQKRSAVDLLSTTKFDPSTAANTIH